MSGSSPRVRGKRQVLQNLRGDSRIIPARAGQTDTIMEEGVRCPDHPRACGANVKSSRI